ncbi:MAG: hypothetical protein WDZ59_16835 [Pirellulales bacterium]
MRIATRIMALFIALACTISSASRTSAEPKIGVLTLHGVGSHWPGSAFDQELRQALRKEAGGKATIVIKSIYYHGDSRRRQSELWNQFDRMENDDASSLDHKLVRRLMLTSLGDALAYGNNPNDESSFYRDVHKQVRNAIGEMEAELGGACPVAVVAHSLGCRVIIDYVRDAQTSTGIWQGEKDASEFHKLAGLRLLITTGCTIPFYESPRPSAEQRFFQPGENFQWINFYDRDDLLGWPLRPLGGDFDAVQDEERNYVGSSVTSHMRYWRDEELNEEIARKILTLAKEAIPAAVP